MPFGTQPQASKSVAPHWAPDPHEPKQPCSCGKYWQASVVDVVLVVVVTVHAPEAQASQQLAKIPAQALPPFGATHSAGSRLSEHEVLPLLAVRQQVTKPGLPHVDLEAHRRTVPPQLGFTRTALTCCAAQCTYAPWVVTVAQSQLAARAQKQLESAFSVGLATSLEVSDIDSKCFFARSAEAAMIAS